MGRARGVGPPRAGLMPARPQSIRAQAIRAESIRADAVKTALGGHEAEADAAATRIAGASPASRFAGGAETRGAAKGAALAVAARSADEPLDAATRAVIEPQIGAELGGVRIHRDAAAADAADALQANAFTIGRDVYFAARRYEPHGREGRRLLVHELSHVVQQAGGAPEQGLTPAGVGMQCDKTPTPAANDDKTPKVEKTFTMPPDLLPSVQLTPPSLLAPRPSSPFSFGKGADPSSGTSLAPGDASAATGPWSLERIRQGGLLKSLTPSLTPSLAPGAAGGPLAPQTAPNWTAVPPGGSAAPAAPATAPQTITLKDFGMVSVAVRFSIPDTSKDVKPGEAPTALQDSLRMGEIMNYHINGVTPSFASLDVGKLIAVGYSIFATHIDPGLAQALAAKVSAKPSAGPKLSLDATAIFQTSPKLGGGGGLVGTFTF
jgi:hypothetical protein